MWFLRSHAGKQKNSWGRSVECSIREIRDCRLPLRLQEPKPLQVTTIGHCCEKWWAPSADLSPHLEMSTACQHFDFECYGMFIRAYPCSSVLLSAYLPVLGETCFHQTEGGGELLDYIWNGVLSSPLPTTRRNLIEWLQQRWWKDCHVFHLRDDRDLVLFSLEQRRLCGGKGEGRMGHSRFCQYVWLNGR